MLNLRSMCVAAALAAVLPAIRLTTLLDGARAATLQLVPQRAIAAGAALFEGPPGAGLAGISVAVGDFNGDGAQDLAIGVPNADAAERRQAGAVYVEFGPFKPGVHVLGRRGGHELVISGAAPGDRAGIAVANAGNVTGDGRDGLIIGAYEASDEGRSAAGAAYVIFDRGPGSVDLANLGAGGFRIDGAAPQDNAGRSVAALPLRGGGGRSAVVVGAPGADPLGRHNAGAAYVVAPAAPGAVVDLAALGAGGFAIDGAAADDMTGWSVANAGDVNGDGSADLAIGAPGASLDRGSVSVLLDPGPPFADVDLAAPRVTTLELTGSQIGGLLGWSVAGVGDLTGSGLSDVAAGAWAAAPNGHVHAGLVDVILGSRSAPGAPPQFHYVTLAGTHSNAEAGRAVAGAPPLGPGDRATLLVGSSALLDPEFARAGGVYALFGLGAAPQSRPLRGSLTLQGSGALARTGDALAAGANLLGDGRSAIAIGAPGSGGGRGQVYVVPDPAAVGVRVALPARDLCSSLRARRIPVRVTTLGPGRVSVVVTAGHARSRQRSLSSRGRIAARVSLALPGASAGGGDPVTVTVVAAATRAGGPVTHAKTSREVRCAAGDRPRLRGRRLNLVRLQE